MDDARCQEFFSQMRRRTGFTLTELLVVIAILLVLSTLAFAVFNSGRSSDRMRSGARTAQSAFLGAKDRALHAKGLRGVRLTRDATNLNLINGFVYLQPLPLQSAGYINGVNPMDFSIARPGLNNTPPYSDATRIVVATQTINASGNLVPTEWQSLLAQDTNGIWPASSLQIRIPSSLGNGNGQWYQLQRQSSTPPYWWIPNKNDPTQAFMYLQTGYSGGIPAPNPVAVLPSDTGASCDIQLGNDLLPFHQPITLPSGCVIDLNYCNNNVKTLAGYFVVPPPNPPYYIDVMFSPRGNVTGPVAALGALYFCLRDLRDATNGLDPANPTAQDPRSLQGDQLILAVTPQTGLVQTYPVDPTDANGDGKADNIFSYAQRGMSAGQ